MGGGVTYQGVIPPNRFGKSALNLEIEGYRKNELGKNLGKYLGLVFCRGEGDGH